MSMFLETVRDLAPLFLLGTLLLSLMACILALAAFMARVPQRVEQRAVNFLAEHLSKRPTWDQLSPWLVRNFLTLHSAEKYYATCEWAEDHFVPQNGVTFITREQWASVPSRDDVTQVVQREIRASQRPPAMPTSTGTTTPGMPKVPGPAPIPAEALEPHDDDPRTE